MQLKCQLLLGRASTISLQDTSAEFPDGSTVVTLWKPLLFHFAVGQPAVADPLKRTVEENDRLLKAAAECMTKDVNNPKVVAVVSKA